MCRKGAGSVASWGGLSIFAKIPKEFSRKDLQPAARVIFAQSAKIPHRRAKRFLGNRFL
ncbi:hypothetical protein MM35RIKEN_21850 (plasmid) [Vescimonas fastidiosa]|uniref:Uncharacterized protein n=1 Tax=Vescimonas fastidiosa TaxID=2714353 RepID=A0A810Q5N6_9FIRM|nr:hypothetical protein MM35RIKEN_21850 [Vescimonas fastidiosa]